MNITGITDKKVGAFEARRNFGQMLKEIEVKGDRFVVERHGEPVAAVVPIVIYEQWKKARKEFFARIRASANTANLTEREVESVITKALKKVRGSAKA